MHTNYYKVVKQLKSFKIIIVAATCFGLHEPSSGGSQPVLRYSYNVDFRYISLFEVIGTVAAYAPLWMCTSITGHSWQHNTTRHAATKPTGIVKLI